MKEKVQLSADPGALLINRFELRLKDGVSEGKHLTNGKIMLHSEIWVDGKFLDEPHFINLPVLIDSLYVDGWCYIFTCSCGEEGCAGIIDGIHVTHHDNLTRLVLRRPQSAGNLLEPAVSAWEQSATPVELIFERSQMLNAIQAFLDKARSLIGSEPQRFDWPVYGFDVCALLSIDPRKPYYSR
jgi:hypothetical protein